MDGKATQTLFAKRQASVLGRPPIRQSLPLAMVVPRHQPHRPQHVRRHAFPIVGNGDRGFRIRIEIKADNDFVRVGIICVLDQFEDSQTCTADQFVAQQLQHPGHRAERLTCLIEDVVTQDAPLSGWTRPDQ